MRPPGFLQGLAVVIDPGKCTENDKRPVFAQGATDQVAKKHNHFIRCFSEWTDFNYRKETVQKNTVDKMKKAEMNSKKTKDKNDHTKISKEPPESPPDKIFERRLVTVNGSVLQQETHGCKNDRTEDDQPLYRT